MFLPSVPCLTGPIPHVGRPVPDEMFALLRREQDRADKASPLVRARVLESLPSLFPDVSDLMPEPPCHDDLERGGISAMERSPLVFDRELVARIRAVHDAPPLIALALRDDATLPEYTLGPDEPGPRPSKSFLRYRALANIPTYWIADNRQEGRRLLLDRLRSSADATESLLLHGAAEAIFDQALWGHPERATGTDGPGLLGAFLADTAHRLQSPPDRASLELVLVRLDDIGSRAVRFGHESAARGVVRTILDARGDLPITRGDPAAARDLLEIARGAQFDLDHPQKNVGVPSQPPPRRERFRPREDWLDREPAGGRPSEADRLSRVRDLDAELPSLKYNVTRCYILGQLGEWLSDAEAASRYDAFVAPAFDGDAVRLTTESLCRLRVALEMRGVPEERRIALALRMLRTPLPARGARDLALDEHHPAIAYPADEDPVRQIAALALAKHPAWIDATPDLRAFLTDRAMEPIPRDSAPSQTWSLLHPSFDRVLEHHLSKSPDAARSILRAWMSNVRDTLAGEPPTHIYVGDNVRHRIRSLGDHAGPAGLAPETAAFLDALSTRRDAVIARYLLDLPPVARP